MSLQFRTPDVYIVEQPGPKTIQGVGTSVAAFLGQAPEAGAHPNEAVAVNSWPQFCAEFTTGDKPRSTILSHAVFGFFNNGGSRCYIINVADSDAVAGTASPRSGLQLLEEVDDVSIVAAPGRSDPATHSALLTHCQQHNRMAICDPPAVVKNIDLLKIVETAPIGGKPGAPADSGGKPVPTGLRPPVSSGGFGAFYFPWIYVADPFDPKADLTPVPPSGAMAGIWARVDTNRGVHKAPANEIVNGALNLTYRVTSAEQADLNSQGVNCIRFFPSIGTLVWGARTLAEESSEWRYLPVRRLVIMLEESIKRATRWVVFEPNDRTLWKTIRSEVVGFLTNVHRDGALMGKTAEEAFFVICDESNNPPPSIDAGQVNILIGIAPVKPAEFVIFRISQFQAGAETEAV